VIGDFTADVAKESIATGKEVRLGVVHRF
jgi:hypothetical protein